MTDVPVGREDESVDDVASLEGVEVLALVQVPEHGDSVLSTGGAERAVGGDGDGGDVAGVAPVRRAELALAQLPNLSAQQASQHPVRFSIRGQA